MMLSPAAFGMKTAGSPRLSTRRKEPSGDKGFEPAMSTSRHQPDRTGRNVPEGGKTRHRDYRSEYPNPYEAKISWNEMCQENEPDKISGHREVQPMVGFLTMRRMSHVAVIVLEKTFVCTHSIASRFSDQKCGNE